MAPNVVTFSSLIDACASHDDIKNAEETSEKMRSAGELPDVVMFNSLIGGGGGAKHGDIKKAEEIFEKTRSAGELPGVCHTRQVDW